MSPKFQSTQVSESQAAQEREQARALRLAFAIAGQLVACGFVVVDLTAPDWHERFSLMVEEIAFTVVNNQ